MVQEKEEEGEETPSPEEEVAHLPQVGSWAEEPSSLCPEPAKEPLEQQVATLTASSQKPRTPPPGRPTGPASNYLRPR